MEEVASSWSVLSTITAKNNGPAGVEEKVLPVLVHGAAMIGQGEVYSIISDQSGAVGVI